MRPLSGVLAVTLLLALSGCASPYDPRDRAIELSPGQPHQGLLGPGTDIYVFTLDKPSDVVLESRVAIASSMTVTPNAVLYDAEGNVVRRDWRSGDWENFRIATTLPAGTWYLHVYDDQACFSMMDDDCMEGDRNYEILFEVTELPH
ncbi:hypothetical protein L861_14510 [Litchfieldella anticariensis FP35 = DSM 16096]|uniref:Peptidase C-terminal archaeal/bacterial domain-containing protein n=1 Tax=Litchfieldella anticariensis (strain DSM 16096 / CECT 5854 / CIP 108499 / LMG 22089 / FP35) TaxID=1121939 RepID=S2KIF3_LITA3|nr:hypothetical protein [Halomonas anticariensis]EPC00138.1 hypothetical protein L861_14510 [Halomonas anticariensis FP35 = DSM 16096]